ncbi:MAG: sulfotransferase, partial [Pseudomonadota bacterium]
MKPTLVYILATSYSGSTLLTYLLAQHSRVATAGELKAPGMGDVDVYRCSCGELIKECPHWAQVEAYCREHGVEFSVDDFDTIVDGQDFLGRRIMRTKIRAPWFEAVRDLSIQLWPGLKSHLQAKLRRNFVVSQGVCHADGGDVFVDGSKDATRLRYFIDSGLWNVRVVYMTRDGRAVANSFKKHRQSDMRGATSRWIDTTKELQRMRARLDDEAVLDLKYETLCTSPQESIQAIWEWLGLAPEPIREKDFKSGNFHLLGNAMRLSSV